MSRPRRQAAFAGPRISCGSAARKSGVLPSFQFRCKGLTDFETYSVIPLESELSGLSRCISVIYVCKFGAGNKPVNKSRFASFPPVFRVETKIIRFILRKIVIR